MSKADRLRRLKRKRESREKPVPEKPAVAETRPRPSVSRDRSIRPTPERMRHGNWQEPSSHDAPAFDAGSDMIGALYASEQITPGQHDAARLFQSVVAAWIGELGTSGYRSCLDISVGGYDSGDGDPSVKAAHDALKAKLGAVRYLYLRSEVDKPADRSPADIETLRTALDAINR